MNPQRLFIASCVALITSAFSFMIRQNITDPLRADFGLSNESIGAVMGAAFLGMAFAMLVVSPICDAIGMGRVLALAWFCHLIGIVGTLFAAPLGEWGPLHQALSGESAWLPTFGIEPDRAAPFRVLWLATFLVGCGNGLVEVAINPLAATLFPNDKTHYLNVLHAWWPGGLILSGLLAIAIDPILAATITDPSIRTTLGWKIKVGLLLVPLAIYGIMSLGQKFPDTERVQANVSTGAMFAQTVRPMFLLWAFCMLLTAASELAPNQWQEAVLTRTAKMPGTLVFVYTSGLMFAMRFFAGPIAHRLSPVGMLTVSAILAAGGLYGLSAARSPLPAFLTATAFGIGVAYFWPTMLGVTAERFPKGGALLLGLMGSVGNLSIAVVLPMMGAIYDSHTVAALKPQMRKLVIRAPETGFAELPLVVQTPPGSLPSFIADQIYPAGYQKLNPAFTPTLQTQFLTAEQREELQEAEALGAASAFRWVAVLPGLLVIIFGLIALSDLLRGGYRAERLSTEPQAS